MHKMETVRSRKGNIYIDRNPNGSYTISDDTGRKMTYYFYTKRQALNKFKKGE